MASNYFTKEGMRKYLEKIQEDQDSLTYMYSRVTELADVGGDQYHDNFSFEQNMRDIKMINDKIVDLKKVLVDAVVLDLPVNPTTVCFGASIIIERDGVQEAWDIRGYGESDPDNNVIAYNTPLIQALMGKKVNDVCKFGLSTIIIKSIK